MLAHDVHALVAGQQVPLARLDERVDEEVLRVLRADLEARLLGVLGLLRHREVRVGRRRPAHEPGLGEDDVELVDRVERGGLGEEHEVGVAARAHERERPQEVVGGEVLARRQDLLLVGRPLPRVQAAPGRVDLEERVLDELSAWHVDCSVNYGGRPCGWPSSHRTRGPTRAG